MKKIGIDARLYSQTGIGTYLQNFLFYLDKNNPKKELFYVYLKKEDFSKVKFNSKNLIKKVADYPWHSLSEQLGFLWQLNQDKLDLMHFTYFSYPIFYSKKFIATVHDLTPLLFRTGKASTKNSFLYKVKYFFYKIILETQVKKAVKILTPSKTVKDQLINKFGQFFESKIFPIHLGVNCKLIESSCHPELDSGSRNKPSDSEGKFGTSFFIYVGNFYPHKNVERLIYAFSKVETSNKLILLGPNDFFKNRLFQLINRLKQEKKILFFNNPLISDLVFFYKNALALIHPSLSEGFGLPLIEAAYFNCPIIASDINVFKELLGNSYLSFNPKDVNDISSKIKKFLEKKPNFNYKNILKQYSFQKMTVETVKIYQKILYGNK